MVDRIGKGGAALPPTETSKPSQTEKASKTFDVQKSGETKSAEQVSAVSSSPLEALQAGKIDFNGYLDAKVNEATSHLQGLAPDKLDSVKSMLRARMATDPELVDLVTQATGHAPSISDDE